jgi:hypothetical protein
MHRGQDHDHANGSGAAAASLLVGHNRGNDPRRPVQWQSPHRKDADRIEDAPIRPEADLDLVEAAFTEGFLATSDATSFLRLARIPFEGSAPDGAKLALLRVEIDDIADVGSLTPHLGGDSFRYDPLPARMVSRRKRLRFVYFDGQKPRMLSLAEVRALSCE